MMAGDSGDNSRWQAARRIAVASWEELDPPDEESLSFETRSINALKFLEDFDFDRDQMCQLHCFVLHEATVVGVGKLLD